MKKSLNEQKKTLFEEWAQNDHVLVHIDSRDESVIVPIHLKDQYSLTLKISYLFQGETKCDDNGISSYLKFHGDYFQCILPWSTIWGLTSDEGVQKIWKESLPKEIIQDMTKMMIGSVGTKLKEIFSGKNTKENDNSSKEENEASKDQDISPKRKKPNLKRIK